MAKVQNLSFFLGYLLSLFAHTTAAVIAIIALEQSAAIAVSAPEVFTVTIEGGKNIGGISQAPIEKQDKKSVLPFKPELGQPDVSSEPVEEGKAVLEKPTVVKDPEIERQKLEAEKKRKAEAKKKAAEKKKKAEAKKRKEAEKKRKAEERKKKAAEEKRKAQEAKKRKAKEKKLRDKRIQEAVERASNYTGESANAGGQGLGAARLGGSGMGGGTLASAEFIAYQNALEGHIKRGWRWGLPSTRVLQAKVRVNILPTGVIKDARVMSGSGNPRFDDSVLRAVYKSSPVPPAPEHLYSRFREVNITFDSQ